MKILRKITAHIKLPTIQVGMIVTPTYLDADTFGIVLSCGKNSALVKLNGGWTKPLYILIEDLSIIANNSEEFNEKFKSCGVKINGNIFS